MNIQAALPEGSRGRVLAVAILFVALAVLWLSLGSPLRDWYDARAEQIGQQRAVLAHMRTLVAAVPALAAQPAPSAAQSPGRGNITDALAAADTEQLIERLASEAGTNISSTETLPPDQGDGVRRIRLRLLLHATWPDLLHFLGSIETAATPLLVDDLDLQSDGKDGEGTPIVRAAFSVIALRAAERSRAAPP
jgi:general secretion pathway protein M